MATNNSIFTDNLTYHPIQEWTGDIINFGMPTFDGNYRLTEIITSSQGAQEATMRAIELAKSNSQYEYASSAPVLFIVRELFGNTNIDISTMAPVQAGESFIESEFEVAAEIAGKNWMLDYTIPADLGHLEGFNLPMTKFIEGPRVFTSTEGTLATGNYQTDGMPWIRIEWQSVDEQRCQDPSITDTNKCDNAIIIPDHCSYAAGGEILISRRSDGTLVPFANSKSNCENRQTNECWRSTNGSSWSRATWWTTEEECIGENPDRNDNYWFHWNVDGNVWGGEVAGATWPTAYTTDSFVEYNLKESEDRTKWPETWTSTTAVNHTIHFSEIGNNGLMQDGRATRIWRVANDHIFDITNTPANCSTPIVQDGWCDGDLSIRNESDCTANGHTWKTSSYVIADQTNCEAFGFTWNMPTTTYGDPEEMPIDEDAFIIQGMPAHAYADNNNAVVNDRTASTSGSNLTVYWRAPQRTTTTYARAYPPPDRYRVYRTRYYKDGLTNDSDWVNGIKVFVGEVEHTNDYNNHSITESSRTLMGLGVRRYEYVYYFITSVWDDWNQMSSGLTIQHRTEYDNYTAAWTETIWVWDFWPFTGHDEYIYHPEQGDRLVDTNDFNQVYGQNGVGAVTNYWYQDTNVWAVGIPSDSNNVARQAYGYFRARVTGNHNFWLTTDDDGWFWLGNAGETYSNLIGRRTNGNANIALPGDHPAQTGSTTVYLTAGQFYPILAYGANHGGAGDFFLQFQEPGGHQTYNGMYHYYNSQSLPPTGQEVEGRFSSHVGGRFT